jgi:hypothetical protein
MVDLSCLCHEQHRVGGADARAEIGSRLWRCRAAEILLVQRQRTDVDEFEIKVTGRVLGMT